MPRGSSATSAPTLAAGDAKTDAPARAGPPGHAWAAGERRRCDGHCDKVVYPGACLARSCPFVYSYEAWGHTYVGCMQKIYDVEIDLDMLRAAERHVEIDLD